MELGNLEETRSAYVEAKNAETEAEQGGEIVLLLTAAPHGVKRHSFKAGVTVAYVKLFLEQQYGLPPGKTVLKAGGKALIDPLSLCDCPGMQPGKEVEVEVSSSS